MTIITSEYDYVFDEISFGIDVRDARKARGMTQAALADSIGGATSETLISNIETGSMNYALKMTYFIALCNVLDLRPSVYFDVQHAAK